MNILKQFPEDFDVYIPFFDKDTTDLEVLQGIFDTKHKSVMVFISNSIKKNSILIRKRNID